MRGREPGRREEQGGTDEQPGGPVSGHVQDDDEQAEQQHRGTQVLLEDQDADAHAPHDEQGAQVAGARQAHPQHLAARQGQVVPVGHQVGGEEDRQQHLGQLGRLEAHRADPDPDAGAVDALADPRDEGKDEEDQAGPHGPPVPASQAPVVAQQEERDGEEDDAQQRPDQLLGAHIELPLLVGLIGQIQAPDHGQADPVERHRRRQEHRIGPRGGVAHTQVHEDGQDEEGDGHAHGLRRGGAGAVESGEHEAAQPQDQGDAEQRRLRPASRVSGDAGGLDGRDARGGAQGTGSSSHLTPPARAWRAGSVWRRPATGWRRTRRRAWPWGSRCPAGRGPACGRSGPSCPRRSPRRSSTTG